MKKTLIQEYLLYLSKNRVCGIPSQLSRTDWCSHKHRTLSPQAPSQGISPRGEGS